MYLKLDEALNWQKKINSLSIAGGAG